MTNKEKIEILKKVCIENIDCKDFKLYQCEKWELAE